MPNALDLRDASVRYGTPGMHRTLALDAISLSIAPGECVGIVGPAGAGTTTLLLCAGGLLGPDSGSVRWFGSHRWLAGRASYAPATADGHQYLSVRAWLEFADAQRPDDTAAGAADIGTVMGRASLTEFASVRVGHLTPGVAARVAIAGALLASPQILLIDRAFDGLTPSERARLAQVLDSIRADGVTMVVAARDPFALESLRLSRLVRLAGGRVVPPAACDAALELDVPLPIEARSRLALRVPSVYRRGRVLRVPLERHTAEQVLSECRSLGIEVRASRVVARDQPTRRRVAEQRLTAES